jgi:hypothetical protein
MFILSTPDVLFRALLEKSEKEQTIEKKYREAIIAYQCSKLDWRSGTLTERLVDDYWRFALPKTVQSWKLDRWPYISVTII